MGPWPFISEFSPKKKSPNLGIFDKNDFLKKYFQRNKFNKTKNADNLAILTKHCLQENNSKMIMMDFHQFLKTTWVNCLSELGIIYTFLPFGIGPNFGPKFP